MRRLPLVLLAFGVAPAGAQEGAERMVRVTEGTNFAVAASPDGERLVMDLQGTLWLLPMAGGSAEALTDGLGDDRLPDFHPEGGRVAYQSYRSGTWDIWQLALGGQPEQLTDTGFDDREPAWSPDGARIAFSSDRAGSYDIWILDVATGEELWSAELPMQGNANPMTYLGTDGRQYVAVTATEEVIAFRLR